MTELPLQSLIKFIEEQNDEELDRALQRDSRNINEYFSMDVGTGLGVKMTPLQFAVKQKSPACIKVLLKHGADTEMTLKTPEDKVLRITALKLAKGEKDVATKHAETADAQVYEEIIDIFNDHVQSPKKKEQHAEPPLSPGINLETHRMALTVSQNQLSIKNLQRENSHLRAEVDLLKQDVANMKKWVDKWIYEQSPTTVHEQPLDKKSSSSARTAASRARKKADNGDETKIHKKKARPQSVMLTSKGSSYEPVETHKKSKKSSSTDDLEIPKHRHRKSPARVESVSSSGRTRKDGKERENDVQASGKHRKSPSRRETVHVTSGKEKRHK